MNTAVKPEDVFVDPKEDLLKRLGDLSRVEIAQNEVLLATYMRPKRTASGFYLPDQNLKEDQYQGKTGLVVKIGAACRFVRTDEKTGVTYGIEIKLHDWVVVRTSDTWPIEINAQEGAFDYNAFVKCRLVYDDQIRMRVPYPGMVW